MKRRRRPGERVSVIPVTGPLSNKQLTVEQLHELLIEARLRACVSTAAGTIERIGPTRRPFPPSGDLHFSPLFLSFSAGVKELLAETRGFLTFPYNGGKNTVRVARYPAMGHA